MALNLTSEQSLSFDLESLIWADLPSQERGEANQDDLFVCVGKALTTWEYLETNFALAFAQFCNGRYGESLTGAAARTYGLVQSGPTRRKMLDEVAEMYSVYANTEFDLGKFKQLTGHYQDATGSRNKIAHGVVSNLNSDGVDLGWFLVPSHYNTTKNIRVDKWASKKSSAVFPSWQYSYTANDITHFTKNYEVLDNQVRRVVGELIQWKVSLTMSGH